MASHAATNTPAFDLASMRQGFDKLPLLQPSPPNVSIESVPIARPDGTELMAYWITPADHADKTSVLLYLHGGAYVLGSLASHRGPVAELARRANAKAFFVDYRLGPENSFSAAVEDALAAYKWLLHEQKVSAERVVFVGDSAGGGLTLLTLLALQEESSRLPNPRAAVTLSAWTDLSLTLDSITRNAAADQVLKVGLLEWAATLATGLGSAEERKSPKFSPVYASADKLAQLPPLFMSVGQAEILEDDTTEFARRAKQAGAQVELSVVPGEQHVFPYNYHSDSRCEQELQRIAEWVKAHQES